MLIWFTQSYWRDEAFSVLLAQKPILELILITAGDFSPPLYYLVLKFWMGIFGPSELATRSLSLVFFVAMLVSLVFFARNILRLSLVRAFISILLLGSVNPLLLLFAAETRMYTLVAFLVTMSWYFLLQSNRKWYVFSTVLGLFTHYFMILILLTQAIYILIVDSYHLSIQGDKAQSLKFKLSNLCHTLRFLPKADPPRADTFHVSRFMPIITAFSLFIPWLAFSLILHEGGADTSSFWISRPGLEKLWTIPGILLTGFEKEYSSARLNLYPLTFAFWIVIVVSLLDTNKVHLRRILFLGLWTFMPAIIVWTVSQFATPLFLSRYLIISTPAIILLISTAISRYKTVFQYMAIGMVIFFLWNYQAVKSLRNTKEDLWGQIHRVEVYANRDDYLIVESELDYHVAQVYWFDKDRVKIVGKTYAEIPTYVGKSLIPPSAIVLRSDVFRLPGYVLSSNRIVISNQAYGL